MCKVSRVQPNPYEWLRTLPQNTILIHIVRLMCWTLHRKFVHLLSGEFKEAAPRLKKGLQIVDVTLALEKK